MTIETTRRSKRRCVRDKETVAAVIAEPPIETEAELKPKSRKRAKAKTRSQYWPDSDDTFDDDSRRSSKVKTVKPPRVAGVSTKKFPPISETKFGILQEKLWREPFWLLIAVTFLNKTAGRSAAPVFWKLKELYPTPAALAASDESELIELIRHLGLQTQRARRLIRIATAWVSEEPCRGRQYRTLHYPVKNDGKAFGKELIELDARVCAGLLEIGRIPGCGPYAWDSWRIFCRDVLRGVADDYNGLNATSKVVCNGTSGAEAEDEVAISQTTDFEPEWKRVLPLDKELRAYLRWMWLREGYIWNHETGERREVTEDERKAAIRGELEAADDDEAYFTAQAREDVYDGIDANDSAVAAELPVSDNAEHDVKKQSTGTRSSRRKRRMT